MLLSQAALLVVQRAFDQRAHVVVGERLEHEHARAREQRGVDLERRVLGRRADQRDGAVLDVRQHRVLLRLVEAVDLVDEQHGAPARGAQLLRVGHDAPQVGDAGADRGEPGEVRARLLRDDARERRLPGAGRPPQDHRRRLVGLDRAPQRAAGPDDLLLADELVERARPHPRGERLAHPLTTLAGIEQADHVRTGCRRFFGFGDGVAEPGSGVGTGCLITIGLPLASTCLELRL